MTTRLESSTSIKQWATEPRRQVEGQPPGPEDRPSTIEGEARKANVKTVTPNYKIGEGKPSHDIHLGQSGYIPHERGDYKVQEELDKYKLTVIDPRVRSNAYMPSHTIPDPKLPSSDFPSEHSRRSQVKLEPLEQRRFRSVETRPITTSEYLTKSVDRHRDLERSRLKEYLKAKEGDANQPWNKPGWPGPKQHDDEKLRELESMRKSIERLEKEANKPKKDVSSATWQFSAQSFSPRSVVSMNGGVKEDGLLKVRVDHSEEIEKPRSIMKRRELESREDMMGGAGKEIVQRQQYNRSVSNVSAKPRVTETVQRFEETKRTEEIERRVQRKERRERRSRHEWSSSHHGGGHRSSSMSRGYHHNGYLPSNEGHWRQETTRRHNGGQWEEGGPRYGSLSDSLRRGELKYGPNGEVRESFFRESGGRNGRVHKSYSTRDVFHDGGYNSMQRGSHSGSPFVEYPPTLPRRSESRSDYRPVSKSRSYADWDDRGRAGWGMQRRDNDEMSRLEAEFRDSTLLMPLPNGKMHERDDRHEQIPGGYETYHKENRADSGRRLGRDGRPVDFNEASTEYSYRRETEQDGRHGRH